MSVLILCGVHKALYKIQQETGIELPYSRECRMSAGKLLTTNVMYFRSVCEQLPDIIQFYVHYCGQRNVLSVKMVDCGHVCRSGHVTGSAGDEFPAAHKAPRSSRALSSSKVVTSPSRYLILSSSGNVNDSSQHYER